jgi:hypothetical protein
MEGVQAAMATRNLEPDLEPEPSPW